RYLDELLVYPGPPNRPDASIPAGDMSRFYAEANARHFDVAIQLQDCTDAWNGIVARLGAPHWAGFVPDDAALDTSHYSNQDGGSHVLFPWPRHLPEIQRYSALLQHLGIAVNSNE